ncbi:MAG: hypothetical protein Q9221_001991 [Calogaya cf. arnoldii]
MHYSSFLLVAALPFLNSASPTSQRSSSLLLPRGYEEERGCNFDPKFGFSYINNVAGDGVGNSCFGWPNRAAITCNKPWSDEERENIKKAVREQATKDGQFETSSVGEWTAGFQLITTAFDDRDTSAFDKVLDAVNVEGNAGRGQLTYYWQRSGDYISVIRGTSLHSHVFGEAMREAV